MSGTNSGGGGFGNFFPFGKDDSEGGLSSSSSSGGSNSSSSSSGIGSGSGSGTGAGGNGDGTGPDGITNGGGDELFTTKQEPRLRQLTRVPTAGFVTMVAGELDRKTRYVERETGNIFEVDLDSLFQTRISIHTIPRIHDAIFGASGEHVVLRYLDEESGDIRSFSINLEEYYEEEEYALDGEFLPENILEMTPLSGADSMFYIQKDGTSAKAYTVSLKAKKITEVGTLPISEWISQWSTSGEVRITTKASQAVPGYLYAFSTATAGLTKVLGNIKGLTTLSSPNGNTVLYSDSTRGSFNLKLLNTTTGVSVPVDAKTLPEKCAWSNNTTAFCGAPGLTKTAVYPDDWYKGVVSFSDNLFRVSADGSQIYLDGLKILSGKDIDVTKPAVTSDGKYLLFINKNDSTLWSYTLK